MLSCLMSGEYTTCDHAWHRQPWKLHGNVGFSLLGLVGGFVSDTGILMCANVCFLFHQRAHHKRASLLGWVCVMPVERLSRQLL
jgi:hypothetical protein